MYEDDRIILEKKVTNLISKLEIERIIEQLDPKIRIDIWFRDDDICDMNHNLQKLLDYFERLNIPLLLAAIPQNINQNLCEQLNSSGILVGQHGYSHINYNNFSPLKSELCSCRNISTVISELSLGKAKLKKVFGEKFVNVLIPPYFEMDEDVAEAVEILGYDIYSMWWKNNLRPSGILELNCQIDFINWERPSVYCGDYFIQRQLYRELSILESKQTTYHSIGIVLHHDYLCKEWLRELDWIFLLSEKYDNVNIKNIKDIAEYIIKNKCILV